MTTQKSYTALLFVAVVALVISLATAAFVIYVQLTTTERVIIDRIAERTKEIDGNVESVRGILTKVLDEVSAFLIIIISKVAIIQVC